MNTHAANPNLEIVRKYFSAIENKHSGAKMAEFFDSNVVQEEFPNRFFPQGAKRDLKAILESAERGAMLFASQRYEIQKMVASGDSVAVEYVWSGVLAQPAGTLAAGQEVRGHFAVFIEFYGGKIVAQRNYDCFDPW